VPLYNGCGDDMRDTYLLNDIKTNGFQTSDHNVTDLRETFQLIYLGKSMICERRAIYYKIT
jgi:hypothetical protein